MWNKVKENHTWNDVLLVFAFIAILLIIIFIYFVNNMYKKQKNNIKPNHIFLINLCIGFILNCSYFTFFAFYPMFKSKQSFDDCPHYWFGLFTFMAIDLDIIIMQVDRFVAVFWSLEYPGFASNGRAAFVCCVSKVLTAVVSSCVLFLDTDYTKCGELYPLLMTRTTNMIFISCPQLCVTGIVGIVSAYLGFTMVKLKKSVNPIVNLQVLQPQAPEPHPEISHSRQNAIGRTVHVKRIDDQPNMFYSVDMRETSGDEEETKVENSTLAQIEETNVKSESNSMFLMAKTALNMNYVVIIYCLSLFPRSIMSIIFCNCDPENGDCDVYLLFYKFFVTFRIVSIFVGCFVFFYKIKKISI
jgi:hypothetical protein